MKYLIFILSILTALILNHAHAQQYIEKQESTIVNTIPNAGFESGKGQWTISVSSTASIVSGVSALQGASSLRFDSTAVSQTVASRLISVPKSLQGKPCQLEGLYYNSEPTNYYLIQALDASGTVLTSTSLNVLTSATVARLTNFNCPTTSMQARVISTSSAAYVDLDAFHLGSIKNITKNEVVSVLGYEPVSTVTASSPISITGGASNPVVSLVESGVTSGTSFTRVLVDGYGRVTSGGLILSSEIESSLGYVAANSGTVLYKANNLSDLASATVARNSLGLGSLAIKNFVDLGTSEVSGTLISSNGGTGFNTYSTGDLLVASGTGLVKLPIGLNTQVLTSDGSTAQWLDSSGGGGSGTGFNFLSNPTFEKNILGYTQENSAGTNGVASQESYAVSSPTNTKYFRFTFGQNNNVIFPVSTPTFAKGLDCEFGGRVRANSGTVTAYAMASGTPLTVSSSVITSQALTLSTDWQELPKVFSPCSQVGDMAWAFAGSTSGTVVELDDLYTGLLKSSKTGAIIGPTRTYTPTLTGFGSATNIAFSYTQRGDKVHIEGSLTAGTYSGVEVRISLPNNWTIKSPQSGTFVVGKYARGETSTNHGGFVLGQNGVSYVVFSDSGTFSNSSINALSTVTALSSNGVKVSFNFEVPVDGLQATGTTLDSQCKTDLDCTNEFSARISATGVVSDENLDWINGNCSYSAPLWTCNFNSGVFSASPNCTASPNFQASNDVGAAITTQSSSTVTVQVVEATASVQKAFVLRCAKQGADYKAKNVIEAYLSKTVTSTGNYIERTERARVVGTTEDTVCSSSPCTILRQSGGFSSVTRIGTGQYELNFSAGTFLSAPDCVFFNKASAANTFMSQGVGLAAPTATKITVQSVSDTGSSTDAAFSVHCTGPR